MAAPTFRGIGAYGSGTTSFTAAAPTAGNAPQVGDLLIIIMESTDSTTTAGTPTTPNDSGGNVFSKIFEQTFAAGSSVEPAVSTLTIFAKLAVTGGLGNVSISGVGNHCSGAMLVVAGHGVGNVATGIVVGTAANHGTGTTNILTPSINVRADSFIVQAIGFSDDAADTTNVSGVTNANLASITERIDNTVTAGSGGGVGIYTATCAGTTTGTTEWDHDTAAQSESVHLGIPPQVEVNPAATGAYVETGVLANLNVGRASTATPGSFALAGIAATFVIAAAGIDLSVDPGAFTQTGIAATTIVERSLSGGAATGSYQIGGVEASLAVGRSLDSSTGSFSLTGSDATFSIVVDVPIVVDPGSFEETGFPTTLLATRSLNAEPAVFSVTGTEATLARSRLISTEIGAFNVTGPSIALTYPTILLGTIECDSVINGAVRVTLRSRPKASWGGIGGGGRTSIITNRKKL